MTKSGLCQCEEELSFSHHMIKRMRLTYHLRGAHLRTSSSFPGIPWERWVCSHFACCNVSTLWRNDKYCGLDESIDEQLPLMYFWEVIVLASPRVLSRELFPSNSTRQNIHREEFSLYGTYCWVGSVPHCYFHCLSHPSTKWLRKGTICIGTYFKEEKAPSCRYSDCTSGNSASSQLSHKNLIRVNAKIHWHESQLSSSILKDLNSSELLVGSRQKHDDANLETLKLSISTII